jgi:hypothetical protein
MFIDSPDCSVPGTLPSVVMSPASVVGSSYARISARLDIGRGTDLGCLRLWRSRASSAFLRRVFAARRTAANAATRINSDNSVSESSIGKVSRGSCRVMAY